MTHWDQIRVLFCLDSFAIGGTELNAIRTAEALDKERFKLTIAYLQEKGPLRERYEALGIEMVHLPIPNLYSHGTARSGQQLARLARNRHIDIVHAHDIYTNIFSGLWIRLLSDCRLIHSRRWWHATPRPGLASLNRWSYRFAHRILANSEAVAKMLVRDEHIPAAKVIQIPNFLSEQAFTTPPVVQIYTRRKQWGVPPRAFVIGVVARLAPVKNHQSVIRAVHLLGKDAHLVLVGDGSSRGELERLAGELDMKARVHFAGEITTRENLHHYFDISVLCSMSEGFPNSIIEALAAARAVVATPVGGVVDVVTHGVNGMLTPVNDPVSLASRLQELKSKPELRQRLGLAGRQEARSRFHQSTVIGKLSSVYEELAADRRNSL